MRPIRLLLLYVAGVFFTGALIAPWIYYAVQWGALHWTGFDAMRGAPFHRFVNRAMLLCLVLFLWPLLRGLRMNSWRALGFGTATEPFKNMGIGFLVGWASLGSVAVLAIEAGARSLNTNPEMQEVWRVCRNAVFTAIFVALLEETVFRGALFGALRKKHSWPVATVVSSAIYALAHFFSRPRSPSEIEWFSGFLVLGQMMRGFADIKTFVPAFFILFFAGAVLAVAYQRTGNLFCAIGLHAGWIFWLKSYNVLTRPGSVEPSVFWGSEKITDGWAALFALSLVLVLLLRQPQQSRAGEIARC